MLLLPSHFKKSILRNISELIIFASQMSNWDPITMAKKEISRDSFCLVYVATSALEALLLGDLKSNQRLSVQNITKSNK